MSSDSSCSSSKLSTTTLVLLALLVSTEGFSLTPQRTSTPISSRISSSAVSRKRQSPLYYSLQEDEDDEDDDDEEEDDVMDVDSLGDWRTFRRNLVSTAAPMGAASQLEEFGAVVPKSKSVSKANELLLQSQNEALAEEYISGVWAHETSTPEVAGLVLRMPLEVELRRNYRHSLLGAKLSKLVGSETAELSTWYARAQALVAEEMQTIASTADDQGQVDTTRLKEESTEMLGLYLDSQETWQEVGLVLEKDATDGSSKTLVINRPMAMKLTENIGKLVLNGAFMTTDIVSTKTQKDLMRFMMAFGPECAVYVGGPDDQDKAAIMIHGMAGLPGASEIAKGSGIYQGGIPAAVQGVLDGKYQPLDFRFFFGCHAYDASALDVAVHLGKYQPIACARAVALKQCIALPKPLWHEVLELCGGMMADVSSLELMKRDDLKFQFTDLDEFDDEDLDIDDADLDDADDDGAMEELDELTDYDEEEDDY